MNTDKRSELAALIAKEPGNAILRSELETLILEDIEEAVPLALKEAAPAAKNLKIGSVIYDIAKLTTDKRGVAIRYAVDKQFLPEAELVKRVEMAAYMMSSNGHAARPAAPEDEADPETLPADKRRGIIRRLQNKADLDVAGRRKLDKLLFLEADAEIKRISLRVGDSKLASDKSSDAEANAVLLVSQIEDGKFVQRCIVELEGLGLGDAIKQIRERIAARELSRRRKADAGLYINVEDDGAGDDALAREFTRRYKDNWRYVAEWSRWFAWDGKRWQEDKTLAALDMSRKLCRQEGALTRDISNAKRLGSIQTIRAVEAIAKTDRGHAMIADCWDKDTLRINTPLGTVDLRTGAIASHRREDYNTKITNASPNGDAASCPKWLKFLEEVTDGDTELHGYLQRIAGYCLTASTREQALFFLYGSGCNGKSNFIETMLYIMGDYAGPAEMDLFLHSKNEKHPTGLAGLRGLRMVCAVELEAGSYWSESRIKTLTGQDTITARLMRQDFFTFKPQFKILISANNKPSLRQVDDAIKRRIHLIPFMVNIKKKYGEKHIDQNLVDKFKLEADGIMDWAVRGCLEWQRIGLAPPSFAVDATDDYFEEEDTIGHWVTEGCEQGPRYAGKAAALFESWCKWAEANKEFIGNQKRFAQQLEKRGFKKHRTSSGYRYRGLDLKGEQQQEQESVQASFMGPEE